MGRNVKRISLDSNADNSTVEAAIQAELDIIDAASGTDLLYDEFYCFGRDKIVMTFVYTTA